MEVNWRTTSRRILEEYDHHQNTSVFEDDKFMKVKKKEAEEIIFLIPLSLYYDFCIFTVYSLL